MNDLTLILDADWKQRFYGANMKDYIEEPDYSHNYIVNHDKVEDEFEEAYNSGDLEHVLPEDFDINKLNFMDTCHMCHYILIYGGDSLGIQEIDQINFDNPTKLLNLYCYVYQNESKADLINDLEEVCKLKNEIEINNAKIIKLREKIIDINER